MQSYLMTYSVKITPFTNSKIALNLKVTDKEKDDHLKQVRSFTPNLIHYLDAMLRL